MEVLRENQTYGTNKVSSSLYTSLYTCIVLFVCSFYLMYLGLDMFIDGSISRFKVNPSVQELL